MTENLKRILLIAFIMLLAFSTGAAFVGCSKKSEQPTQTLDEVKKEAENSAREANLREIDTAIQVYFTDTESYPTDINQLVPTYLPKIPQDPLGGTYYLQVEGGVPKAAVR